MRKVAIAILVMFFGISLCMSQNIQQIREQQEQQRRQEAERQRQQEQTIQQQRQREANSHRVIFNTDGGSVVFAQTIYNGERASRPIDPTRDNHAFVEWRRGGESTAFNFNTPITAPITLTAVWTNLNPTVTTTSEGILIQGSTLERKFEWLVRNVESHNTYIVEVNANQNIAPRTFQYRGAINVTIILRGDNINRIVRLSSHGSMFTIPQNITFVLENNITLHGHNGNTGSMVFVNGGTFIMNSGATITGNTGGVGYVGVGGGVINGGNHGSGVCVGKGTFEMRGGTISSNATNGGGGIYVASGGNFTMSGGIIFGNNASLGGGVFVGGVFTMTGGIIFENTVRQNGGGVHLGNGTFTMRGGTITSNTAAEHGGGVFIQHGIFTKTNGTITGFSDDPYNGNVVRDHDGVVARRGHAVFRNSRRTQEQLRREATAGATINLSTENMNNWTQ